MSTNPQSAPKVYTSPLSAVQAENLRRILVSRGWELETRPYMLFFAKKEKVSIAVYEKGPKIVVQGKGSEDFVQFILEPEVLGGVLSLEKEVFVDEFVTPHIGVDESGKGDFFGPLVIAGVYIDSAIAAKFRKIGVQDSKNVGTDLKIKTLAKGIKETKGVEASVVLISPNRYNELYQKFGNLNRLLAWGHARVIENLLEKRPDCPRALSDQFANPRLIERALFEKGRGIELDQRTKAESDLAVAAASILAREAFVRWMDVESERLEVRLPKGASPQVKTVGRKLVEKHGSEVLNRIAKLHFKTTAEILSVIKQSTCTNS
jgi:ribonuclease HIII